MESLQTFILLAAASFSISFSSVVLDSLQNFIPLTAASLSIFFSSLVLDSLQTFIPLTAASLSVFFSSSVLDFLQTFIILAAASFSISFSSVVLDSLQNFFLIASAFLSASFSALLLDSLLAFIFCLFMSFFKSANALEKFTKSTISLHFVEFCKWPIILWNHFKQPKHRVSVPLVSKTVSTPKLLKVKYWLLVTTFCTFVATWFVLVWVSLLMGIGNNPRPWLGTSRKSELV